MSVTYYLNTLRQRWWLICLTTAAALAVALVPLSLTSPVYRSTAEFIITPAKKLEASRDLLDSVNSNTVHSIASTFAEILASDDFYDKTNGQLHLNEQNPAFRRSTVILPNTAVVQMVVEGGNPEGAATLANVLGQLAIDYANGAYRIYDFQFLEHAVAAPAPLPVPWERNLLLGLVLGIGSGTLIALLWEQFRTSRETSHSTAQTGAR